ncbi:hypothetical protein HAX54_052962 [Datura stramonium]|uniref:Uncharacterized protein n=1 Tax=Datura stramonium TaxID=4076 RepID=A0ABS8T0R9_DATST|nr:hypothetical protein [Datura stramonium]
MGIKEELLQENPKKAEGRRNNAREMVEGNLTSGNIPRVLTSGKVVGNLGEWKESDMESKFDRGHTQEEKLPTNQKDIEGGGRQKEHDKEGSHIEVESPEQYDDQAKNEETTVHPIEHRSETSYDSGNKTKDNFGHNKADGRIIPPYLMVDVGDRDKNRGSESLQGDSISSTSPNRVLHNIVSH